MKYILALAIFVASLALSAEQLPTESDIEAIEQAAVECSNSLQERSLGYMLEFYFDEQFTDNTVRTNLYRLASASVARLREIQESQLRTQKKIEDYEDDSWDLKYGKNRLWRRSENLRNYIIFLIQEAQFLKAISIPAEEQEAPLREILRNLDQIKDSVPSGKIAVLQTNVMYVLSKRNESLANQAFNYLEEAFVNTERNSLENFKAEIARLRLLRPFSRDDVNRVVNRYRELGVENYPDLSIQLAFLELETGEGSLLLELLERWPGLTKPISKIAYERALRQLPTAELMNRVDKMSPVERELIVYQALLNKSNLFDSFILAASTDVSYQSKLINFSVASKLLGRDNERAFDFILKALAINDNSSVRYPELTDLYLYTVSAAAGHQALRGDDPVKRQAAIDSFDKYIELVGDDKDEEICFLYAVDLQNERPEYSLETFKEIVNSNGKFKDKAEFELLVDKFEAGEDVLPEVSALYKKIDESDLAFYTDVLDMYSRSLSLNGRAKEAVELLIDQYDNFIPVTGDCFAFVLEQYLDKAELYMSPSVDDISGKMRLERMANIVTESYKGNMPERVKLVYYETLAIATKRMSVNLSGLAEETTQGIAYYRILARDFMQKGNFMEASAAWGKLARALRENEDFDSWKWARAKYYQIKCAISSEELTVEEVTHLFDVLEASEDWTDPFWMNQLALLKPEEVKEMQSAQKAAEAALKAEAQGVAE
jgi:hypothetical protein